MSKKIITKFQKFSINEAVIKAVDFKSEVDQMSNLGSDTTMEAINDLFDDGIKWTDRDEFVMSLPEGKERDSVPPCQFNPMGLCFAAYNYHNDTVYMVVKPEVFIEFVKSDYKFRQFKGHLNNILRHESVHKEQKKRRGEVVITNLEIDPSEDLSGYLSNKDEIMAYAETVVSELRGQMNDDEILKDLRAGRVRSRVYDDYKRIGGDVFKRFVKYVYMYLTQDENEDK